MNISVAFVDWNLCQRGRVKNKRPKAFFNMWKLQKQQQQQQWKNATNSAHCVDILQCIQQENKNSLKIQFQFSTSKIHFVARVECAWKLCIINTSQVLPPYEAYNEIHQSEVQLSIHLLTFFPDSLLDFYTFFTPHTPRTRSTFSFPFPFAFAFSVFQFFNSTRVPPRWGVKVLWNFNNDKL